MDGFRPTEQLRRRYGGVTDPFVLGRAAPMYFIYTMHLLQAAEFVLATFEN